MTNYKNKSNASYLYLLMVLIAIQASFSSCKKVEDDRSPVADILSPVIGQQYTRGAVIYLNASITDDKALDRCEVWISSLKSNFGWDDPWEPEVDIIPLSGTSHTIEDYLLFNGTISIDIKSSGYVINISVFDATGNMTHYSRSIEIK